MCLQCHAGLSEADVIASLRDGIANPEYEKWNTTSFGHTLISVKGVDGLDAQALAKELIEGFYRWFLGRTWGLWQYFYRYNPCLQYFPHSAVLRANIDEAESFYRTHEDLSREDIRKLVYHPRDDDE